MLSQNIFFSNNLIKKKKSKNILITRKKFSELINNYREGKILVLQSFEKSYKLAYSSKLIQTLRKKKI